MRSHVPISNGNSTRIDTKNKSRENLCLRYVYAQPQNMVRMDFKHSRTEIPWIQMIVTVAEVTVTDMFGASARKRRASPSAYRKA